MVDVDAKTRPDPKGENAAITRAAEAAPPSIAPRRGLRIFPLLITLATVAVAVALGWGMWDAYMGAPWTRDGTVRVYVVTMAPQVAGQIVELPVKDNQFVHKGDLLMVIDPTDYKIAVSLNEAAAQQAQANAQNAERESTRRQELTTLAVTVEEKQTYASTAVAVQAQYQQAVAKLNQARVNLQRTEIRSPVNGWVTNLLAQLGDYANVGQNEISVVDADSFWVDGYFEETNLEPIRVGDPASVKLMGYRQIVRGHVDSIARGINVANAQPNGQGLANVNPIFTWVRLAQRIPVRVHIDQVPEGVVLAAGMTATVQIDPHPRDPPFNHRSKTGLAARRQRAGFVRAAPRLTPTIRRPNVLRPRADQPTIGVEMPPRPMTAKPRVATPLTRKLSRLVTLAPDEIAILHDLQSATRVIRRNREIMTEGRKYDGLLILIKGIAIRCRILHDGRRQILNIALPGDFIGFPGAFSQRALYSINALEDCVVAPVPFPRLLGLFDGQPKLVAAIFWSFACEAAMYAEHVIDVGRRSALERIAHFLLELLTRLQAIDLADERSFRMPLTQELIGDALGLSVPHVNRTLRQLRNDELVSIEEHVVIIKDVEALSALADFEGSYLDQFRLPEMTAKDGGYLRA